MTVEVEASRDPVCGRSSAAGGTVILAKQRLMRFVFELAANGGEARSHASARPTPLPGRSVLCVVRALETICDRIGSLEPADRIPEGSAPGKWSLTRQDSETVSGQCTLSGGARMASEDEVVRT